MTWVEMANDCLGAFSIEHATGGFQFKDALFTVNHELANGITVMLVNKISYLLSTKFQRFRNNKIKNFLWLFSTKS